MAISRQAKIAAKAVRKSGGQIGHNNSKVRRLAMNAGFHRTIAWLYKEGDLVKFRSQDGKIRYGTIASLQPNTVDVMSDHGLMRLPCQSLQLVDRIEAEEMNLMNLYKGD